MNPQKIITLRKQNVMRRLFISTLLLFSIAAFAGHDNKNCCNNKAGGRCSGTSSCTACKNCSGCKHCSKEGGTCGVCSTSESKPTKAKKKKKN